MRGERRQEGRSDRYVFVKVAWTGTGLIRYDSSQCPFYVLISDPVYVMLWMTTVVIAVIIQVKAFSYSGLQLIGQLLIDAAEEMGSATEYD